MTDISKYKNVSLAKDTYLNLDRIRKVITPHITQIEEDLEREQAERNVWFTGHSLGAGMATICASRCKGENKCTNPKELHTYGTPRVGWPSYINHIPFKHYRWRNNNDIVTRVPMRWMGYKHHGTCHYFLFGILHH